MSKPFPRPEMYGTWQEWAEAHTQALEQDAPDADTRSAAVNFPPAAAKYNLGRQLFRTDDSRLVYSDGAAWRTIANEDDLTGLKLRSNVITTNPTFLVFPLDGSFDAYKFRFKDVSATVNAFLYMQLSFDGGATYAAGASDYVMEIDGNAGSVAPYFGAGAQLTYTWQTSAVSPFSGELDLDMGTVTGQVTKFNMNAWGLIGTGLGACHGYGWYGGSGRPTHTRFFHSAGLWGGLGSITQYGLKLS